MFQKIEELYQIRTFTADGKVTFRYGGDTPSMTIIVNTMGAYQTTTNAMSPGTNAIYQSMVQKPYAYPYESPFPRTSDGYDDDLLHMTMSQPVDDMDIDLVEVSVEESLHEDSATELLHEDSAAELLHEVSATESLHEVFPADTELLHEVSPADAELLHEVSTAELLYEVSATELLHEVFPADAELLHEVSATELLHEVSTRESLHEVFPADAESLHEIFSADTESLHEVFPAAELLHEVSQVKTTPRHGLRTQRETATKRADDPTRARHRRRHVTNGRRQISCNSNETSSESETRSDTTAEEEECL
ncbi:hypothetical protein BC938DRAFT_483940 [Jimgerdemannia flammicorona]|uniref:Uncharacterized protein n=1 Tax=Jimgerdemannia flammicorona TaxID=994334 RepID=A0A433R056_9FUNG|nr:hypothetical protein BC938DRAFT_483940 [Jimgerdemannia flammicorona]